MGQRRPSTAQIVRPPASRPLREGWTPGAFDGSVIHGGRVFRCARHEGSGDQTRAFTYSKPRTLRRRCP